MTTSSHLAEAGGFLPPTLPSPPASSVGANSPSVPILPHPRATPLKSGSSKESSFINHIDRKILGISRRYEKRYNADFEDESASGIEGRGYETFGELAADWEGLIDLVWISGTPSLQIPYLLTAALTSCSCLPSFPFEPRPTFRLFHKLDVAFFSLLQGINLDTGETLPGFGGGRGKLSTTEKVRLRGLVERTRVAVVEVAGKGGGTYDAESAVQSDDDTTDDALTGPDVESNHGRWEMEIARVYEKTIVELGASLDDSGTGNFG